VLTFYDISGWGMHLYGTRKTPGVAAPLPSDSGKADKAPGIRQSAIHRTVDAIPILNNYPSL
jgi:hypothetical protein